LLEKEEENLRIVYMGTPGFAVPPLKRLIESGKHEIVAVVSQPDRPVGRGQKISAPAVKELALEFHLPVLQPDKIKKTQFDQVLAFYKPDVIIVAAYGKILPPEIIRLPRYGCINIHASLLPKYRGAAPIQWAIINGEHVTGVTIMQMDDGLDTGNIIAFEQVEILDDDDTQSISNLLSVTGGELIVNVLDRIEQSGKVESVPQDNSKASHAPMLEKQDGLIDWTKSNDDIIYRIKGLQPWPGAFSFLHGRAWKFLKATPFMDPSGLVFPEPVDERGRPIPARDPGTVTALIKGQGFTVKTGDGHLLVTAVHAPGKKPMLAVDAINGQLVKKRDAFISDPAFLAGTDEIK
jgi:methionyl-tRNA formyltransferase